ncbi:ATP phosphoribosyltransferase [Desulfovibrio litoralis]|uniref:ATP phosphoribosyltransferase n=1 Tax=Desulfovibrio litoralis DSM 11393 TaxID=1121455 RepID=A0A1M7SBW5_9BACT|nr:ATP phosphoribosyltransferase [Desulfovibrio litoralis]SHN55904.1 ATP phosphoribosyltransferase (homohexameric) [Desulfovibrio litoralis DSM 11393]
MSCVNDNALIKFGIPKGSLEQATIALFAKSGWKINLRHRNYFPEIDDSEISARLCRSQEMPTYIADGILDAGLAGKDWILESGADVFVLSDLVYSKASNRPAKWVLAVAGDSPFHKPEDLAGCRIATEIMGLTKKYFDDKNIPIKLQYSWGATEAKVVEGLADAIVEVTETGTTIHAHGLRIIDEVLSSNTQLIVNKKAWEDPKKRKKIEQINLLLQGALKAESMVGLKMNVPSKSLATVLTIIPALNSPTVSPLQDSEWHALEIIVKTHIVRDLIPQLVEAGAQGIIEYPLNKVI